MGFDDVDVLHIEVVILVASMVRLKLSQSDH